jgi:hypothetical protein
MPKACGFSMTHFIGHGGSDYGSYILAGYHPTLNLGLAVGMNKDYSNKEDDINLVFCLAFKSILEEVANLTTACPKTPHYQRMPPPFQKRHGATQHQVPR